MATKKTDDTTTSDPTTGDPTSAPTLDAVKTPVATVTFVPLPAGAFLAGLSVARALIEQLPDLDTARKALAGVEEDTKGLVQAVKDAQQRIEGRCASLQVSL